MNGRNKYSAIELSAWKNKKKKIYNVENQFLPRAMSIPSISISSIILVMKVIGKILFKIELFYSCTSLLNRISYWAHTVFFHNHAVYDMNKKFDPISP